MTALDPARTSDTTGSAGTVESVARTDDVLVLDAVVKSYPGTPPVNALGGVDLVVRKGELAAIVGPSGSGKSTLLNVIGLLDRATSGTVRIAGDDVASLRDAELSAVRAGLCRLLVDCEVGRRLLMNEVVKRGIDSKPGRAAYDRLLGTMDRWQRIAGTLGLERRAKQVDLARTLSGLDEGDRR